MVFKNQTWGAYLQTQNLSDEARGSGIQGSLAWTKRDPVSTNKQVNKTQFRPDLVLLFPPFTCFIVRLFIFPMALPRPGIPE